MSFLSKVVKGIGSAAKAVGNVVGTGLKVVASTGLVPGVGGKAVSFVGNLLAPKKTTSSPAVIGSAGPMGGSSTSGSGGFLSRIVKGLSTSTVVPSVMAKAPALPVFSAPLTGLQKTVFPNSSGVISQPTGGGNEVDLGKGFGFKLPSFGNSSGDVDSDKKSVPVWAWVAGGAALLAAIFGLVISLLKRKR